MNYFKKSLLSPHIIGFQYQNFNEFLVGLGLSRADLVKITGLSSRTLQRHCNQNKAPQWLYIVSYCAAGYLLSDNWSGWRLSRDHGLINRSSPACKHKSIQPTQINGWNALYELNRGLTLKMNDLSVENRRLIAIMSKVDHRRLVPNNVIPFNTTYKNIYNNMKGEIENA